MIATNRGGRSTRPAFSALGALAAAALSAIALLPWTAGTAPGAQRLDGFNVIMTPDHPFGSASARRALADARQLGAGAAAIVPFLWQPNATSPDIVRGSDMPDPLLRAAIRDAHAAGLAAVVKPHVWVPQSWAGAVAMESEAAWQQWFANYQRELERIAAVARDEKADALVIGTELSATTARPQWRGVIKSLRAIFSGTLVYVAHNVEDAETVPFWDQLDLIGASLYPPLGSDDDAAGRQATMRAVADRLDALAWRTRKSVLVGEIGLRSAQGATAKPWESAEERASAPDPGLQAAVLADWIAALDRPAIRGVLVWRWFTDPDAGGAADTDFTVQGKTAEQVLRCAWTAACTKAPQRP